MPRDLILGTAGHIDHGKTSLVKALTGIDCDRLPEEKARGITIDLGFAHLDLAAPPSVSPPLNYHLGIVDVPGHERFIKNMLAGATGIDLALLIVAADDSVMPQTREHVAACELLGIRRAVVAVTKLDRVGEEVAQLAGDEALALLEGRLEAEGVPDAWAEETQRLLGLDVPDATHGPLQDIHWSIGAIGYFPTYTLGNLMAAQLWDRVRADLPALEADIEAGRFSPLREWLREHVHRHGRKFPPRELLHRVTGQSLSADPFLDYLEAKLSSAGLLAGRPAAS